MEAALSSKGQITIPKEARQRLNIGPGDRVKLFFDAQGRLSILPKVHVSALYGIVGPYKGKPVTLEEMEEGIAEGATARYRQFLESCGDDGD